MKTFSLKKTTGFYAAPANLETTLKSFYPEVTIDSGDVTILSRQKIATVTHLVQICITIELKVNTD
ncbi:MAG: hypothetical protein ABUT20_44470 [Bacteroidota bacterium]